MKAKGFTLIELMVVIAIMGIFSVMGFAGLQGAIENNRVNDAALNVTAFLERVANEASRRSEPLCLAKNGDRRIDVHLKSDCTGDVVDHFEVDSPLKFVSSSKCSASNFGCGSDDGCGNDWLAATHGTGGLSGVFKPRLGLSAAPASGSVCVQYGDASHYAAAVKSKKKNSITALVCDEARCEEP